MRRRPILFAALLLGAVIPILWLVWSRHEPAYLGHPISYWIEPWQ
jgi:hypothetical protein